jgi:hypothetical protein
MKNKNMLLIIGIILIVLIIIGGVYLLIPKNSQNNPLSSIKEGTYINENNHTLRCTFESITNDADWISITKYYDINNNLIGNCRYSKGPYLTNNKCANMEICDSSNLYNIMSDGECKGYRGNKYSCTYS